jgi:oligoendopeptidase F
MTIDTMDEDACRRYDFFLDEIFPKAREAEQELKEKLLASGLEPARFEVPLRNMQAEAGLFRQENLPLLGEDLKLGAEYDRIIGAQTVEWEGQELTVSQLLPVLQNPDRSVRERVWRLTSERQLADRDTINELWGRFMAVRGQLAANAGLPDYRSYRWIQKLRFDYTPADCYQFHQAIEDVAVPAALQIYEKRRRKLGVNPCALGTWKSIPWTPAPASVQDRCRAEEKRLAIFRRADPQLGAYFETMRSEGLLDLDNRKGKPRRYCTQYYAAKRPFIFANSVGLHDDVQTLLHEGGHAFHVFETNHLPYYHQLEILYEFLEVASMGMEFLAGQYLAASQGGFAHLPRRRVLESSILSAILFWPYMAVVDAFQHWVYENHSAGSDPACCDAKWAELWKRFMPGEDWGGLEQEMMTGWQRKLHIHEEPFYYVEYGLAQLGAAQVWRNSLRDYPGSVAAYRRSLSLGGTLSLPGLYELQGLSSPLTPPPCARSYN